MASGGHGSEHWRAASGTKDWTGSADVRKPQGCHEHPEVHVLKTMSILLWPVPGPPKVCNKMTFGQFLEVLGHYFIYFKILGSR